MKFLYLSQFFDNVIDAAGTDIIRDWLSEELRSGKFKITFSKKDGSIRVMYCTLMRDIVPQHEGTGTVRRANFDTLRVYDLEKADWRSFRIDTIIDIETV